jgi:hypothetical protein
MHYKTCNIFIDNLTDLYFNSTKTELKRSIAKRIFKISYISKNIFNTIPNIKGWDETLDHIISSNKSFIRFGDGEFNLITGKHNVFEKQSDFIKSKFISIL